MTTEAAAATVLHFFRYLDDQIYEEIPQLFADDGIWYRRDQALHGPAQVRRSLTDLPPIMPTVHLITNLQVETVAPAEARAVFYVTALRPLAPTSTPPPWPMDPPLVVALYKAHLVARGGHWHFKTLQNRPIFRRSSQM